MFMDNLTMKFERKKLYDEIWDISLTGVSKKYGLKVIKIFFKEETIKKYINYITDNNFRKIFILGMFIPFLPDDLLCYLAGISNIKTKTFLYSICITKFFTIILYSLFLEII